MKSVLGIVVAAVLSLAAMAVGFWAWQSMGDVEMSTSGYVAMILGGLATLALGGGLMALLFYSNRHGFDEEAGAKQGGEPPEKRGP